MEDGTYRIQLRASDRTLMMDGTRVGAEWSQRFRNHSPDGFNWGYGGSGPSQLALAILLHVTTPEEAKGFYQEFKWEFVAKWPADQDVDVTIDIRSWLAEQRAQLAEREARRRS